jgi:hypothetical protein
VQAISWTIFLCGIPVAVLSTAVPEQRSSALLYALTAAYCLLSLSYEALVLALLAAFLRYWTRAEERRAKTRPVLDGGETAEGRSKFMKLHCSDILVLSRIRIRGFVPLTNGSRSGSISGSDSFLQ